MNRKLYLIILSAVLDREAVIDHLSSLPDTSGWFYNMPNTFFIKSSLSAEDLSDAIINKFSKTRHFITEVSKNRQGILPKDHWELFYKKNKA